MENTPDAKKRKADNANSTFVWAKEGNHESAQEHAAYLLQPSEVPSSQLVVAEDNDGEEEHVYVRWCSTGTISRIRKSNISTGRLSSRRCRRAAAEVVSSQHAPKRKSRLSLSKKQRQHWRDQQQSGRGKDDQVQRTHEIIDKHKSINNLDEMMNENKSVNLEHENIADIGCLPAPVVSVDDSDGTMEEKKEDDTTATIQPSKAATSSLPCNPLVLDGLSVETKSMQPQQQQLGVQKEDNETIQSNKQVSTLACKFSAQEEGLSLDTKHETRQQNATTEHVFTHRSSAYVQHLAEACNIIMTDARWRTLKQSGNTTKEISLFSWEEGDDLSAVKAFVSLYDEATTKHETETQEHIEDVIFERSMNLYSRIYHRKGPWFDLADIYVRYYAPKVSDNAGMETERSKTSLSNQQAALRNLFDDIVRLQSMGLIRSFESEHECGSIAGQVKTSQSGNSGVKRGVLLSAEERREVLRMLGGGKSTKASAASLSDCTNEILAQMQSQKTLFAFAATKSEATSLLPVRKHVDKVLLRKLANKVVSLSNSRDGELYTPKKAEVEMALKMIESEWKDATKDTAQQNQNRLLSTIRLREAPLQTLRRVMRLFLCAGGGPGSMRGDGTNGWRSCYGEADWHKVEYPGLNTRFGLEVYPMGKYFVAAPEQNSNVRMFETLDHFRLFEIGAELRSSIDQAIEAYETEKMIRRKKEKLSTFVDKRQPDNISAVDVFHLLTKDGRCNLVKMVSLCTNDPISELELLTIFTKIEKDVHQINTICDSMSEQERLILCTSVVCRWMLQLRIDNSCLPSLCTRPWLRHLSFDAILTYIAWDGIPFCEKRNMYVMAASSLTTILFGIEVQSFCFDGPVICAPNNFESNQYMQYLLPRRNRGKAIERLLIDLTHAHRKIQKEKTKTSTPLDLSPILACCRLLLMNTAASSSIPFSSIRNLARRLKAPLLCTMNGMSNDEMSLLSIRLDNTNSSDEIESCAGYRDWTPQTDNAVANSLSNVHDESAPGKRCAFIGWESNDNDYHPTRSLNVEELALEEYQSGRLPNNEGSDSVLNGNWEGWHDEGGHVRKLFRIIFLQAVLENASSNDPTTFLTPYQQSPHDLHVGYQKVKSGESNNEISSIQGFYHRRRNSVETFLSSLSQQTDQSLCDIVYASIRARWDSHNDESRGRDASLLRDVAELRTLSMIAAGLGGQALSSIFRALAFDYRHYSGGLPDLLLARARCMGANQFVDLGEWIGEAFSQDFVDEENLNRSISMLADRDDDFLGCSKNADSSNSKFKKKRQKVSVVPIFPTKLQLIHNEQPVKVDCMFVEVKSANDRLDARQEDWLNIIDVCADARVCKFENKKESK